MLEFHFNEVAGLKAGKFIKRRLQHRFFSCEICEVFKNTSGGCFLSVFCSNQSFKELVVQFQLILLLLATLPILFEETITPTISSMLS